jgi:hypothetical protein
MAHRILLREIVIDVPTDRLAAATAFWTRALDTEARPLKDYTEFVELVDPAARCVVGLQDVGTAEARYHVDIESDDVEAEVARLVRLGATEVSCCATRPGCCCASCRRTPRTSRNAPARWSNPPS